MDKSKLKEECYYTVDCTGCGNSILLQKKHVGIYQCNVCNTEFEIVE